MTTRPIPDRLPCSCELWGPATCLACGPEHATRVSDAQFRAERDYLAARADALAAPLVARVILARRG